MKKILATSLAALLSIGATSAVAGGWGPAEQTGLSWPSHVVSSPERQAPTFGNTANTTIRTTYDYAQLPGGLRAHGMRFTIEGDHDRVFYETNVLRYGVGNTAARGGDIRAGWRFTDWMNVQGQYETNRVGNVSGDRWMLGLGTEFSMGALTMDARALTDVNNAGSDWQAVVRGQYGLTQSLDLVGQYSFDRVGGANTNTFEAGTRYHVNSSLFVDTRLRTSRAGGVNANGASIGVGFSF